MRLCLKPVAGKLPLENRLRPNSERQLCPHTQLRHIGLTASFYSSPRRNDKTSCLSVTRWKRCPSYVCHLSLTFVKKMKLQLQMIHSFLKHVKYDSLHQRVLPVNRCYTSTCHSLCSDQLTYDIEICFKGWGFVFFPLFWLHHPALQCTKDLFCRNGAAENGFQFELLMSRFFPGLVIPKPRLKPVKARWSHLKANTSVTKDADTEQQQLATNVAATGMTLQSNMKKCIHTCIYIVHIQLKIEYLNLELAKWFILGISECEHFDFLFFSMQGHVERLLWKHLWSEQMCIQTPSASRD